MKRRNFLKAFGAISLVPAMPSLSFASASPIAPAASAVVDKATYKWAEMIVRAHNQSSVGMLQRLLHLDAGIATALQGELVKNGVLVQQANSFGIHTAVKPLYEGAFVQPHNTVPQTGSPRLKNEPVVQSIDPSIDEDEQVMALMLSAVDASDAALLNPTLV